MRLIFLLALSLTMVAANPVAEIWVETAVCDNCDMSSLGMLGVKICGSVTCCFTGLMGGYYNQGYIDKFSGPQIGECEVLDLGDFGAEAEDMSVTLYHSGTDGGQFTTVSAILTDSVELRYECSVPLGFLDDREFVQTNDCIVVSNVNLF